MNAAPPHSPLTLRPEQFDRLRSSFGQLSPRVQHLLTSLVRFQRASFAVQLNQRLPPGQPSTDSPLSVQPGCQCRMYLLTFCTVQPASLAVQLSTVAASNAIYRLLSQYNLACFCQECCYRSISRTVWCASLAVLLSTVAAWTAIHADFPHSTT